MAVRTMGCSACGAVVPYGRLSCPECGELLASVSGARREAVEPVEAVESGAPAMPVEPVEAVAPAPIPDVLHEPDDLASMAPPAWRGSVAVTVDDDVDALDVAFPPVTDVSPMDTTRATDQAVPDVAAPGPEVEAPFGTADEPAWPEPAWPEPASPEPADRVARDVPPPPPGSYVPPPPFMTAASGVGAGAMAVTATPAGTIAPARAWAGYGPETVASPVAAASSAEDAVDPTAAARIAEAVGWVAIAGAVLAAAGFLLPWARTIIGASGDSYLDRWGFAGPFHPLIVLAILAVLVLAVVKNPVPAWLRLGLPGLGLGALLLGLLWPYVFGPLGAQPGAFVSMLGSVMLIGVGIATLVLDRHAADRPVV